MEWLFILVMVLMSGAFGVVWFFSSLILPWINRYQIRSLKAEVARLNKLLEQRPDPVAQVELAATEEPVVHPPVMNTPISDEPVTPQVAAAPVQPLAQRVISKEKPKRRVNLEQQLGAKLPVWIGAIAIVLGGVFLVKYSIENNLISPSLRLMLAALLGTGLLYGSEWLWKRPDVANGVRIGQAMAGSGVAVLYGVFYAATSMYGLVPVWLGFAGMALLTAMALLLALRAGPPIAVLGLIGGFATPALLSSDAPSAVMLFGYLYLMFAGAVLLMRRQQWWFLAVPVMVVLWLWVLLWVFGGHFVAGDALWLGLFLLAVVATLAWSVKDVRVDDAPISRLLHYVGMGVATLLMGLVAGQAEFTLQSWGLFLLLALAGIGLAYFNTALYSFVPWVSMVVSAVMLLLWDDAPASHQLAMLLCFAGIYVASAHHFMLRLAKPILWGGLLVASAVIYYLVAYVHFYESWQAPVPFFWGEIAIALAALATWMVHRVMLHWQDGESKPALLTLFTAASTGLIALAVGLEMAREWLTVVLAVELAVLAWLGTRFTLPNIRWICAGLFGLMALLLLPQCMLLVQLAIYSLFEKTLRVHETIPMVQWPLFQLGIPALMVAAGSYYLRLQRDGRLVRALEVSAVLLLALMGYYGMRHLFQLPEDVLVQQAGFLERGVVTNVFFAAAVACFYAARRWERVALQWCGMALSALSLVRLAYFDMLIYNPLWASQPIDGWMIANALTVTFGITLVWAWYGSAAFAQLGYVRVARYVRVFMIVMLFAWVSGQVRFYFHGSEMDTGITTNAEIYSYSVAWLVMGVALLLAALWKESKMLRYASLAVLLLTVGKVFLYDASELEGLYRVVSFLGLGASLIALSWVYSKFVFGRLQTGDDVS